jgi:hypothetical protein
MSTINTNPINVNYPVPGVNNNSQGFRDNFASIVTNLNTAATELTDLQSKVVVKQALIGTVVNNDMANTLISNASTVGFRATTYNLGNALAGTVLVNASLADVHYGTVAANTTINFGSWPPTGTQSNIQVRLSVSNPTAVITFSGNVLASNNTGATTLENFVSNGGLVTVTAPYGVTEMDYIISTTDCGNTLYIEPINRPRQSTQIQQRIPTPTGYQGDVAGEVAVGPSFNQLTITTANTTPFLTTSGNTTQLYTDLPIVFTGTSLAGNIVVGTTYYVRNVVSSNTFTVSSTVGGANVAIGANASGNTMFANPVSYIYVCTAPYNSSPATVPGSNTVATGNVINFSTNHNLTSPDNLNVPIIFSGNAFTANAFGGLTEGTIYYVKTIPSGTSITVSASRTSGTADSPVALTSATPAANTTLSGTYYIGSDIWKRIALTSW